MLKEQKDGKKKGKRKAKAKANRARHDSDLDSGDLDTTESKAGEGIAGYSNIKPACISKALMSWILAYAGSDSRELTCSSTIADSGASAHMTPYCKWFKCGTFKKLSPPQKIHFEDDSFVKAIGVGTIALECNIDGSTKITELEKTLYVLSFQLTLVSIHCLDKAGYYTVFKNGACKVKTSKGQKTVLTRSHKGDLYHLSVFSPIHALVFIDINILHHCLAHVLSNWLIQIVNDGHIEGIDKTTGKL